VRDISGVTSEFFVVFCKRRVYTMHPSSKFSSSFSDQSNEQNISSSQN
jgi:hypothetical protein